MIVPAGDVPVVRLVRKVDELIVRESGIVPDVRVWFDDAAQNPASMSPIKIGKNRAQRDVQRRKLVVGLIHPAKPIRPAVEKSTRWDLCPDIARAANSRTAMRPIEA